MRQAIVHQERDGLWFVVVPSLPGCISRGATREAAVRNAAEAVDLWGEARRNRGEPIPEDPGTAEVVRVTIPSDR